MDVLEKNCTLDSFESNSLKSFKLYSIPTQKMEFKGFCLKKDTYKIENNLFLTPEYVKPSTKYESIGYETVAVFVCPDTYFSSTNKDYFYITGMDTDGILKDSDLRKFVLSKLNKIELINPFPEEFYTSKRTLNQGIISYQLAMNTSNLLYLYNPKQFQSELHEIAKYAITIALLHKKQNLYKQEFEFLFKANKILQTLFGLEKGFSKFKILYQLTAISLYFGDFKSSKKFIEFFIKNYRKTMGLVEKEERIKMKSLLEQIKQIWLSREKIVYANHQNTTTYCISL